MFALPTGLRHCKACANPMRSDNEDELCSKCRGKKVEAGREHRKICNKPLNKGNLTAHCTRPSISADHVTRALSPLKI